MKKNPSVWYNRVEIQLFLFFGAFVCSFIMFLLYKDVMKDETTNVDNLQKKNNRLYGIYFGSMVFLCLVLVYFVFSFFGCAYYYNKDKQIVQTYRAPNKKVKDMSSHQKKKHYASTHAKTRMTLLGCGRLWAGLKTWTIISSILAFFLYPYVKEKKTKPLFFLLAILMTPAIIILSGIILIIIRYGPRYIVV